MSSDPDQPTGPGMDRSLSPVAAYDILPDGSTRPVTEDWPAPAPSVGAVWRWLHCDRTSAEFAAWAAAHLPLSARAGLMQAETRPRCDSFHDGLMLNLHGINLNEGAESEDMVSLRLWVTDRLIVTTRHRRMFVIDALRSQIEDGHAPQSTGIFVARLADALTAQIEAISLEREDRTDEIEEMLLDDKPDVIHVVETEITQLARSVIKLRRHVAPQREALSRLTQADLSHLGAAERFELREVANRTMRTVEELDTVRERIGSLRAHIDSLHAARMGRNGYVLSIVAAVFLPLGFLTGLFGVNVAGMPGTNAPWAFAVLTVGMAVLGVGLWLLFRWLRWF